MTEDAQRPWNIVCSTLSLLAALTAIGGVGCMMAGSTAVVPLAALSVLLIGAAWSTWRLGISRGRAAIRRHLARTPYGNLIHDLLTPTRDYRWSTSSAQLVLPTPPVEVVLLLRKLRDRRELFTVTADPMALHLNPSVETLFLRGHAIEQERIRQDRIDPIITISHNNATAVLAQFGDFKWEQDVIEEVMGSIPLSVVVKDYY